ncbi:hypothetical protein ABID52_001738 [Fictibacillus halophilus]|uniref:Lycopene cyclase domain-containing protein n=1 Tax=Fictibacillus halophilus TaxID=1610490 RepID=A0ABV2LHU2_9BACL
MKVYFWLFLLLSTYNFLWLDIKSFKDLINPIITVIGLLGIYGYVYKKNIFHKIFWKGFFVFDIIYTGVIVISDSRKKFKLVPSEGEILFPVLMIFILLLIYFRTLYKYAFK